MMEVRRCIFNDIVSCRLRDLPLRQESQCDGDAKELNTKITGLYLVRSASICQDNDVLFGESSNKQCTAIAAYSVLALCEWMPPFTEEHLDKIVRNGDLYYRECRKHTSEIYLACGELLRTLSFDGVDFQLSTFECAEGTFAQVDHLTDSVITVMGLGSSVIGQCGFLFTGHLKTVSFVPLSDRQSLIFNSHCVDADNGTCFGRNRKQGRARLFKAYNIEALVSALLADHPRDGAPWQIVMIPFERKDP